MVRDICAIEWGDPGATRFGRKGQKQYGVDVYGKPIDLQGRYRAAQCKLRTKDDALTEAQIEKEVGDARGFPHPLDALIIVTDLPRDTNTQILIDRISEREVRNGGFKVLIWFWEDVTERLATYTKLIVKYYRDYFANLTTLPLVEQLVGIPLRVVSVKSGLTGGMTPVEEGLRFRGIRILDRARRASSPQTASLTGVSPDGLMCQLEIQPAEFDNTSLQRFASAVHIHRRQMMSDSPVFVLLPSELAGEFLDSFSSIGGDVGATQILAADTPVGEVVNRIFQSIFDYGYRRRGGLSTVDVVARTSDARASSGLLDLDWHTKLDTHHFPSPEEWDAFFAPALDALTSEVLSLGDSIRVQIDSRVPLPAAFALGFYFNLRVARVGVWARRTGVSDFKQQFWLSDTSAQDDVCSVKSFREVLDTCRSAIVELTTHVSIHRSVESFAQDIVLEPDRWLEIGLRSSAENLDESTAIAYANQVANAVRQLNAHGVADVHLFARMPSALAVLIGQRLQACGRIHLYWFDNPGYRYAFTLR
jgi:hypothetical protein